MTVKHHSAFAPGSAVVVSGRALAPQSGREVSAVLVGGEPVDSLDAAGRFFKTVLIREGENSVVVQVVEPGCGEYESILRLLGSDGGPGGLEGYTEATAQLRVEYADTTFSRSESVIACAGSSSVPNRRPGPDTTWPPPRFSAMSIGPSAACGTSSIRPEAIDSGSTPTHATTNV